MFHIHIFVESHGLIIHVNTTQLNFLNIIIFSLIEMTRVTPVAFIIDKREREV